MISALDAYKCVKPPTGIKKDKGTRNRMRWVRNLKIHYKLCVVFGAFIALMVAFIFFTSSQFVRMDNMLDNTVKRQTNLSEALNILSQLRFNNISTALLFYDDEITKANFGWRDVKYYKSLCDSFLDAIRYNHETVLNDDMLSKEEKEIRRNTYDHAEYLFIERFMPCFNKIQAGVDHSDKLLIKQALMDSYIVGSEILTVLNRMYKYTDAKTKLATDRITNESKTIMYSLWFAATITLLASFLGMIFIAAMIKTPIMEMETAMEEISKGNLKYPVRSEYTDEFGSLANHIGDMVDKIADMNKTLAVMDHLETRICITDLDYHILYMNKSFQTAYGVDREKCKNQKCYTALRNYDSPCEMCQLPKLWHNKDTFPSLTYTYAWDEFLGAWLSGRAAIIRWVDGSPAYFHSSNDETLKKTQEEQLRLAMQAAEAASASKTAFLATMSHEIRTPMNSIMGFSELAMDSEALPDARDYLHKIMENSTWLLQIVNNILDISKIESGKMELESIPFDLHEMFAACRTIITPNALEKGLSLYFYAEPSIGQRLLGDPTRLRQVLLNLLSNAVKFTHSGMVKLSATVTGPPGGDPATIAFEIKDSGIGMTPEQIEKIAEPFVQADSSTTRQYGGTGLGLSIAKNLVEMMGGTLKVESTPKVGSLFSFALTFPTIDADNAVKHELMLHKLEKPLFHGEILLCEDNRMNQQVISAHLERVGLKTVIAGNGKEGVETVRARMEQGAEPFDLIFMDIHMPVMDGLEAAPKIAAMHTGTPIIAMTANVMTHDKELYRANGLLDCMGKPFSSQELWRCLLKYLTPVDWKTTNGKQGKASEEKLRQMLRVTFVNDNRDKCDAIAEALAEDDVRLAHRLAHTLKSNAGTLGKTALQKAAEDVENLLADGKNLVTREHLNILETEMRAALREFALLTPPVSTPASVRPDVGAGSETGPTFDVEKERALIARLEPLLEEGDPECLDLIDGLRSLPGSAELIARMESFDFDSALAALAGLKNTLRGQLWTNP
jgi:signal transduction histidine kinase/HPt (histidine-containing phosphotransfer) domain-containing protein/HAMP domain-containing protein